MFGFGESSGSQASSSSSSILSKGRPDPVERLLDSVEANEVATIDGERDVSKVSASALQDFLQ